jgi:hypothetical protein
MRTEKLAIFVAIAVAGCAEQMGEIEIACSLLLVPYCGAVELLLWIVKLAASCGSEFGLQGMSILDRQL